MKNIYKLMALVLFLGTLTGCEEDLIIFSNDTFIQLQDANDIAIVENSGDVVTIVAQLASPQSSDTTVNFDITGDAGRYAVTPGTSIVIAAGETSGSIDFEAVDNDTIDGDVDIVVALSTSSGLPVGIGGEGISSVSKTITIVDDNVPCNDYLITVTTDRWGSETHWDIIDSTGTIVANDGPYVDGPAGFSETYETTVNLADGCYSFRIYDTFGDGMDTGSYSVVCGSLLQAEGEGDLDGFPNFDQSTVLIPFFTANPFGTDGVNFVEVTDFCVNQ